MFEALVTACLLDAGDICAPLLLPGYEAETKGACTELLSATPPALPEIDGLTFDDPAYCEAQGDALSFEEVAEGVFVHLGRIALADSVNHGDVANIGFVIGDGSVAVIDAGSSRRIGEGVWRAIRARTDLPVSHVILTHMHPDHVLGAAPLTEAGAVTVGHRSLNRSLAERAGRYLRNFGQEIGARAFLGTGFVPVEIEIEGRAEIDLGGRVLHLQSWAQAHTNNDLTVFDPATGVLFAGDLVFDRHAPSLDGSLRGWQAALAEMAGMPVTGVVPGHGGPLLDWPEGGAPMRHYLELLAKETRAAIDAGERIGEATAHVAASDAQTWDLFEIYNPQNASVAYTELEWE